MIVCGIPGFGPGSAERSNQRKRNNRDDETLDIMVHQYSGTSRAVKLASQPSPMFSEFASYTDYRSWDMVDGRSYGLA